MATFNLLLFIIIGSGMVNVCTSKGTTCNFPIRKICTDSNGGSALGVFNVTLNVSEAYGGDNWVSTKFPATSIKFRLTPPSFSTDFHNCPVRQFIMNMNAGNNVTFSNGESAVFKAGEIFFCDDVKGSGHKSQAFHGKSRYSVFVEVTETFDSGPCSTNMQDQMPLNNGLESDLSLPLCKDEAAAKFSLFEALAAM